MNNRELEKIKVRDELRKLRTKAMHSLVFLVTMLCIIVLNAFCPLIESCFDSCASNYSVIHILLGIPLSFLLGWISYICISRWDEYRYKQSKYKYLDLKEFD